MWYYYIIAVRGEQVAARRGQVSCVIIFFFCSSYFMLTFRRCVCGGCMNVRHRRFILYSYWIVLGNA